MAITDFVVTSYAVRLSRKIHGKEEGYVAQIRCSGDNGYRMAIFFIEGDTPLPNNVFDEVNKWAFVYRPAIEYAWYLDLLRNESVVTARLYSPPHNPASHYLEAGDEPVGEGEL